MNCFSCTCLHIIIVCNFFLQLFGHTATSVLDGGLLRWKFHGFPTVSGDPAISERRVFRAKLNPQLLRRYEQMLDNHTSRHEQVNE